MSLKRDSPEVHEYSASRFGRGIASLKDLSASTAPSQSLPSDDATITRSHASTPFGATTDR